jgi:hypothetical protein
MTTGHITVSDVTVKARFGPALAGKPGRPLRHLDAEGDGGFLPVPLADLVFVTDDNARALAHLEESVGSR